MADINKPIEVKPTTFARGVPKEDHNGFFGEGVAERLLALPMGTQITVVAVVRLDDDVTKKGKHVRYPVVAFDHLEPIWDEELAARAVEIRDVSYTERTGKDQLDFSGIESEAGEQ